MPRRSHSRTDSHSSEYSDVYSDALELKVETLKKVEDLNQVIIKYNKREGDGSTINSAASDKLNKKDPSLTTDIIIKIIKDKKNRTRLREFGSEISEFLSDRNFKFFDGNYDKTGCFAFLASTTNKRCKDKLISTFKREGLTIDLGTVHILDFKR